MHKYYHGEGHVSGNILRTKQFIILKNSDGGERRRGRGLVDESVDIDVLSSFTRNVIRKTISKRNGKEKHQLTNIPVPLSILSHTPSHLLLFGALTIFNSFFISLVMSILFLRTFLMAYNCPLYSPIGVKMVEYRKSASGFELRLT